MALLERAATELGVALEGEATDPSKGLGSQWFAEQLDARDELRELRQEFIFPRVDRADPESESCVYLCGNSLGLQPRKAKEYVTEELDKWANLGVEGHFASTRPWVTVDELCIQDMAHVVGAQSSEVATMNSLTVNLHLMMVSFYRPTQTRNKILIETKAFPSDWMATRSQIREKGFDPDECLVEAKPRSGEETLRTEDIEALIAEHADSLALVMLSGIQYYTGQAFEFERIVKAVRKHCGDDCRVGFDLAHAAGNLELKLHDWDVDFACWCTYKYLNSGPGGIGGCFVHSKFGDGKSLPRFEGWWGHRKEDRFKMDAKFLPTEGAFGWQLSNPCVLPLATLRASLELFRTATMPRLRAKSESLTRYLELLLESELPTGACRSITPGFTRRHERGSQLSLVFANPVKAVHSALEKKGVICDMREPDVMRIAPAPIYNSYMDVWRFVQLLKETLADGAK
ncbi:Kynureninase [Hondaea fermentalgiana]|uniref:Kynureninase n=1 Tax=Hondaea fermentalgiana TaxID=2315210 RepID=A0A2R5GA94_9STRA|nr:Kynureninase [Hondaea fermentalgiana]|eukprot:GBG24624.1 Kynureninase [Hondaea fermentalgiana]